MLLLAVAVSVLGLNLTTRATNSSIGSAQDLNAKLNILFEITKQFRETVHLDLLLKKIMESAMELTTAESGSLLLYDEDGCLTFKINAGKGMQTVNTYNIKSLKGKGIAAWVAESGSAALISDVTLDKRFDQEFDRETGVKTVSVLCVPLIYSNEIIGVIELRNKKEGAFTEQDKALLHSLADQASISIDQNRSNEIRHSDFIHITEILVAAQDYIQNRKGHARRVANYANLTGKKLNLSDEELKRLYYACLFHDIGMLKIDANELWDREKIMHHPKLGYDLIKPVSIWSDSADIILYQHERYDAAGDTDAEKKDEIPLPARILFAAHTFDVLTDEYSFQKKLGNLAAIEEIEADSGSRFDPLVIRALKASITDAGMINE